MSTVYTTLYTEIENILKTVTNVKEIFKKPTTKFSKYPAVIFFPSSVENVFETTSENLRNHKYKLFVVIGVEQTNLDFVFGTVLANTCDAIISAFDENWSLNSIDGHRCWLRIDAGSWSYDNTENGMIAYAEFDLIIKVLTNN